MERGSHCSVLRVLRKRQNPMILDSSMVEHSAVNRVVAGSSPARGAIDKLDAKDMKLVDRDVYRFFYLGQLSFVKTFCE